MLHLAVHADEVVREGEQVDVTHRSLSDVLAVLCHFVGGGGLWTRCGHHPHAPRAQELQGAPPVAGHEQHEIAPASKLRGGGQHVIDKLAAIKARHAVPQVHAYSGARCVRAADAPW